MPANIMGGGHALQAAAAGNVFKGRGKRRGKRHAKRKGHR